MTMVRLILVIVKSLVLEHLCNSMDVNTIFLNVDPEEEIYMEPPKCFVQKKDRKHLVCKLHISIYALSQFSRQW